MLQMTILNYSTIIPKKMNNQTQLHITEDNPLIVKFGGLSWNCKDGCIYYNRGKCHYLFDEEDKQHDCSQACGIYWEGEPGMVGKKGD